MPNRSMTPAQVRRPHASETPKTPSPKRRRPGTAALTVPARMAARLMEMVFDVDVGGPVAVERLPSKPGLYNVLRDQFCVKDEAGFPRVIGHDQGEALLPLDKALDLAERVAAYLMTPPTVEEITRFRDEYNMEEVNPKDFRNKKERREYVESLRIDRESMVAYLDLLIEGVRENSTTLTPLKEKIREARRRLDTSVRETLPPRFGHPLIEYV